MARKKTEEAPAGAPAWMATFSDLMNLLLCFFVLNILLLEAERIDHGVASIHDETLMDELRDRDIPLTVCPLSNLKLKVVDDLKQVPIKAFLDKGMLVTLNSDDPSYFGGYVNDNYLQTAKALNLSRNDIYTLAKNSFTASFITAEERNAFIEKLHTFDKEFKKLF